jgi:hypothetical protein
MSTFDRSNRVAAARRQWVSPAVKLVGTIAEVLKAGGGKLSVVAADTGEVQRKPKGPMGG